MCFFRIKLSDFQKILQVEYEFFNFQKKWIYNGLIFEKCILLSEENLNKIISILRTDVFIEDYRNVTI